MMRLISKSSLKEDSTKSRKLPAVISLSDSALLTIILNSNTNNQVTTSVATTLVMSMSKEKKEISS